MARLARVVVPGIPHHITQRGNRRQKVFFTEGDYDVYIELMNHWCKRYNVSIWAYCLMPDHVHLIAVPKTEDGLRLAIGEAHRRYTRHINFRKKWRGHLWQGRFASFPMDETYLMYAARYVELNPVRAKLVKNPFKYKWSSAKAHLSGEDDNLVKVKPLLKRGGDWKEVLASGLSHEEAEILRKHENTGRPLGSERFVKRLEIKLGRVLKKLKPGPKKDK